MHLSPKRQQEICSFDVSRKTSSLNPVKMHHYTSCLGFMFKLKFKQPLYVGVPEVWVTSATFCIDGSGLARTKHALLSMACPHKRGHKSTSRHSMPYTYSDVHSCNSYQVAV